MSEIKIQPYFGGFVLETLTVGMYGESRNALREYVQNAFDSIQRIRRKTGGGATEGLIKITMDADGGILTIRDNGAGLPRNSAVGILTSIGASGKDYKREAGFRGIGRLSGIVFSNEMVFSTKASGEDVITVVTFDAKGMREAMKPDSASELSADAMITTYVSARQTPAEDLDDHFFEVKLVGFEDAPEECTSALKLNAFLSQVAPVSYSEDIPDKLKIILREGQENYNIPIESVRVQIIEGVNTIDVVRPFGASYEVGRVSRDGGDPEEVSSVSINQFHSINGTDWWGWWGDKEEPGQYNDTQVSGIRVRVKNIQIDGSDVFRDIFKAQGKSHIRFQDWFIGEIFVKP
ncbi:ATP-binding protein, partial [Rhodoferax sp. 4810]|nr:ATP-binding protein [Rhodoferax jenense]